MFEIGNSLHEARLRQGLDFTEIEQQTKIRGKYLKALEDEKFELLPAPTYVKGFLRNYADALGLEGQLYVDEYNSRFVTGDEDVPLRPRDYQRRPPSSPVHRFEARGVLLTVGAIGIVFALVIAAWKFGSSDDERLPVNASPKAAAKAHRQRPVVRLVLTATNGDSWLLVRAGSATGATLHEGTLQQGKQLAFIRKPFLYRKLWVAVGRPGNVVALVNGRVRLIPNSRGRPEQVVVTPTSIRKAPPAS